ncbi:hypothetical protein EC396_01585 [Lutibacter sp. HS1-25]|uniref:hypothetical protein n=1 Tax=Lutibacter sp. HS1-25 TaxID=2485000 RepID=UPI001011A079|nr:hypothetical protein [Lutibacter sp. HS1-25]RXP63524.1 hypothetical protein EC396_01585 [Lutibacter sp. HS1-25]
MKLFKFKHWEYWPSYLFYLPNIPYAVYLALRAKSLTLFSATNPAIQHSGNGSESKFATIQLIPSAYKPISIYIEANSNTQNILKSILENKIQYPFIIKPDIGFRGLLVQKIYTQIELENYLKNYNHIDLIVQEFVDFKNECGIFYHRLPNETKGKITSITLKKYLTVCGDGISTLKKLIENNERAKLHIPLLNKLHQNNLNLILQKDEEKILNFIGNHSKGTQFINGNNLINNNLETAIDKIMQQIPGFYYGRLDIKYQSFEDLLLLKNFKIIELNGIISEPTHIYDPINSTYFNALKEIRKHWKIIYKIATLNHTINKVEYDKASDFLASLKKLKKYSKQLNKQSLISNKS